MCLPRCKLSSKPVENGYWYVEMDNANLMAMSSVLWVKVGRWNNVIILSAIEIADGDGTLGVHDLNASWINLQVFDGSP